MCAKSISVDRNVRSGHAHCIGRSLYDVHAHSAAAIRTHSTLAPPLLASAAPAVPSRHGPKSAFGENARDRLWPGARRSAIVQTTLSTQRTSRTTIHPLSAATLGDVDGLGSVTKVPLRGLKSPILTALENGLQKVSASTGARMVKPYWFQ